MDLSFEDLSSSIGNEHQPSNLLDSLPNGHRPMTHVVLEDILQPEGILILYIGRVQAVPFESFVGRRIDCEIFIRVE